MWHISGKYEWIPLYVLIIFFIFKKFKLKGIIPFLLIIISIALADLISVHCFKEVFQRLRPCHNPEIENFVHLVNNKCGGRYGFVSSHAANTFALAGFAFKIFKNKYFTISIIFWAAIVSYSRIYLGVHYPADIIGGAILGLLIGLLMFFFFEKINKKNHTQKRKKN